MAVVLYNSHNVSLAPVPSSKARWKRQVGWAVVVQERAKASRGRRKRLCMAPCFCRSYGCSRRLVVTWQGCSPVAQGLEAKTPTRRSGARELKKDPGARLNRKFQCSAEYPAIDPPPAGSCYLPLSMSEHLKAHVPTRRSGARGLKKDPAPPRVSPREARARLFAGCVCTVGPPARLDPSPNHPRPRLQRGRRSRRACSAPLITACMLLFPTGSTNRGGL